eukprot:9006290-Pyramimonas_sp.AAC.1
MIRSGSSREIDRTTDRARREMPSRRSRSHMVMNNSLAFQAGLSRTGVHQENECKDLYAQQRDRSQRPNRGGR